MRFFDLKQESKAKTSFLNSNYAKENRRRFARFCTICTILKT